VSPNEVPSGVRENIMQAPQVDLERMEARVMPVHARRDKQLGT
jgi:hypothetical protein